MEVITMLLRVISRKFYEHSAGLLLFVFFLMFGVVEAPQLLNYHWSLTTGILQSPTLMMVMMVLWMLYAGRAALFVHNKMASAEYEFLMVLQALPRARLFLAWLICASTVLMPIVLYALFMMYVGLTLMLVQAVWILMIALLAIILLTTILFVWILLYSKRFQLNTPSFRFITGKSYTVLLIRQLLQTQTLSLTLTKIFSWASVAAFLALATDGYDIRLPALGLLLGVAGHARLVFELRKFEDTCLSFTRNFPWPIWRRIAQHLTVFTVIMIPEMIMLFTRQVPAVDILLLLAFTVALLGLIHAWLFIPGTDMNRHITRVFWLFMISFLLVLSQLALPLTVVLGVVGVYWFTRYFPTYEIPA
jgi:hypothetical protein